MRTLRYFSVLVVAASLCLWTRGGFSAIRPATAPVRASCAHEPVVALAKVVRSRACLLRRLVQSPVLDSRTPAEVAATTPALVAAGRRLGAVLSADARAVPGHAFAGVLRTIADSASGATTSQELERALEALERTERQLEGAPVGPRMTWREYLEPLARLVESVANAEAPVESGASGGASPQSAELVVLRVTAQGLALGLSGLSAGPAALPPRAAIALDVIGADLTLAPEPPVTEAGPRIRGQRERLLFAATALTGLVDALELDRAQDAPARRP